MSAERWGHQTHLGCKSVFRKPTGNHPHRGQIGYTVGLHDDDRDLANARLIAATPDPDGLSGRLRARLASTASPAPWTSRTDRYGSTVIVDADGEDVFAVDADGEADRIIAARSCHTPQGDSNR